MRGYWWRSIRVGACAVLSLLDAARASAGTPSEGNQRLPSKSAPADTPRALFEVGPQLSIMPGNVCLLDGDVETCQPDGLAGVQMSGLARFVRRFGVGLTGAVEWGLGDDVVLLDGASAETRQLMLGAAVDFRYSLSEEWMASWLGAELGVVDAVYSLSSTDGRTSAANNAYAPWFGVEAGVALLSAGVFSLDLEGALRVTPFASGFIFVELPGAPAGNLDGTSVGIDYPAWTPWCSLGLSVMLRL